MVLYYTGMDSENTFYLNSYEMYTGVMWPNYKCIDCFSYYCATKLLRTIWYIGTQYTHTHTHTHTHIYIYIYIYTYMYIKPNNFSGMDMSKEWKRGDCQKKL